MLNKYVVVMNAFATRPKPAFSPSPKSVRALGNAGLLFLLFPPWWGLPSPTFLLSKLLLMLLGPVLMSPPPRSLP